MTPEEHMFLAIKLTQLPSKSDARRGVVVSSFLGSGTMGDPYMVNMHKIAQKAMSF